MIEYIHTFPGEEGRALPWRYTIKEEGKIEYKGQKVLYAISEVVAGSVCIGIGAITFIVVPGIAVKLYRGMDSDGRPVSDVIPVTDRKDREKITEILNEKYPSLQISFLFE